MRVGLIGEFSIPDEARGIISSNLYRELSKFSDVYAIDIRKLPSIDTIRRLNSELDVINYIPGVSTLSFLLMKTAKIFFKEAKTVMFSTLLGFYGFSYGIYYGLSYLTKSLIPLIKTDLILVQSNCAEKLFKKFGCNVKFFVCSGVNTKKFLPVSDAKKFELRVQYGVDAEKFVVLHVGSIRKWRNVAVLKEIQSDPDVQVVLVGRTSTKFERDVAFRLEKMGCKIINKHIPKIEEVYALSDCYVFPTTDPVGSIDIPLSVLEAMATNLPVISTKFGGLPRIFGEGNGFIYADATEFVRKIRDLKESEIKIKTREMVLPYSWENIAKKLMRIYEELLR